jgi:hypothetical protein
MGQFSAVTELRVGKNSVMAEMCGCHCISAHWNTGTYKRRNIQNLQSDTWLHSLNHFLVIEIHLQSRIHGSKGILSLLFTLFTVYTSYTFTYFEWCSSLRNSLLNKLIRYPSGWMFVKYRVHQGNLGSTASSLCLCWTILKKRYGWCQSTGIQTVFVKLSILIQLLQLQLSISASILFNTMTDGKWWYHLELL